MAPRPTTLLAIFFHQREQYAAFDQQNDANVNELSVQEYPDPGEDQGVTEDFK